MRDLNTTLSRRSIFKAAASAAAALNTKTASSAVADFRPHDELDLTDANAAARFHKELDQSGYVMCEELYPADPGELSGCRIIVHQHGELTILDACIGTHSLGSIQRAGAIADFLKSGATIWLEDGICLVHVPGKDPELRVMDAFRHCFGVVRGRALRAFLSGLAYRLQYRDRKVAAWN